MDEKDIVGIMEKFKSNLFSQACYKNDFKSVQNMYLSEPQFYSKEIINGLDCAIDQGNFEIVKFLVEQSPDIVKKTPNLILSAAREGHLNLVEYLHKNGADINTDNEIFVTAAKFGKLDVVQYFFENGVDITKQNNTALRKSAHYNKLEVVKFLVENGANIHAKNDEAVKFSAKSAYFEQLDYLLQQGGNQEIAEKYGSPKVQAWLLDRELSSELKPKINKPKI